MTMRYQVGIAQTARECAALGGVMTMKVGVQGRVLLGPAGGPGPGRHPAAHGGGAGRAEPEDDPEQILSARGRGAARAG